MAPCPGFSLVDFRQVNVVWVLVIFMTRFVLHFWLIFAVIFCSLRLLFFTVNITNFNNCLIYIMKLQVFVVLWSVVKSPLVLGLRFVATSQFIYIVG